MKIDELENADVHIIHDAKSGRADSAWSGVDALFSATNVLGGSGMTRSLLPGIRSVR